MTVSYFESTKICNFSDIAKGELLYNRSFIDIAASETPDIEISPFRQPS